MNLLSEQNATARDSADIHHAISSMNRISLSEMDSVALMDRVDTKYVLGRDHLLHLLSQLKSEYSVLEVEGVCVSPYATLYFDTPELTSYLDHHNGKLNRKKIRMRKYSSNGCCFFEIKLKNSKGRTKKRRIAIPAIEENISPNLGDFVLSQTGDLPDLKPQLWIYFSRITLVNQLCAERVTFDLGLDFHLSGTHEQLPDLVIAEVKQEKDDRSSPVRKHLRNLGVRPMRVSKYCLGSSLLKPHLKYNRFKRKLLAIKKIA
ncbi:polyphosphate polymerase domain-containing protein [Bythopirellula goksoeyrii]|uniref:VTC domain protein n=1 Tax=Bythopirellula goksoeyrii TaxID=1400387 RepID=A0A5B9QA06_9BACT|nr:polyphosphate polymerase domain-containing protein [Bythopirellula goksoeyrii]QEG35708.1 VTC domain protein [Bythopirellula goksoeyrii]